MIQTSIFGNEDRKPELDKHAKPVLRGGKILCPRCSTALNAKCAECCPNCGQKIDRRALK